MKEKGATDTVASKTKDLLLSLQLTCTVRSDVGYRR